MIIIHFTFIMIIILVGGIPTPSEKIWKSVGKDYSSYIMENVPNHQPVYYNGDWMCFKTNSECPRNISWSLNDNKSYYYIHIISYHKFIHEHGKSSSWRRRSFFDFDHPRSPESRENYTSEFQPDFMDGTNIDMGNHGFHLWFPMVKMIYQVYQWACCSTSIY